MESANWSRRGEYIAKHGMTPDLAERRGIPVSTLARELLMTQLRAGDDSPQAVIARLRSDLNALASVVA